MDLNKAIEEIQKQLKDYVGDKKAIVGLSGGIDSAIVAYLCVQALGKGSVIGIHMPYGDQRIEDSKLVSSELGIEDHLVNITSMVNSFPSRLLEDKLTRGNIMARVRMTVLYGHANKCNGFVIGTTNKTENLIGYFTKYGDGGVDVEPIADLYKTEVWEVGRILGVPHCIINKPPSAELWENQTDENELGMTYKELDAILQIIIRGAKDHLIACNIWDNKAVSQDLKNMTDKYGTEKTTRVVGLFVNSEHKRHMPPYFKVRD